MLNKDMLNKDMLDKDIFNLLLPVLLCFYLPLCFEWYNRK